MKRTYIAASPCQLWAVPTCVLFREYLDYRAPSPTAMLDHKLRSLSKAHTHLAHFVLSRVDDSCPSFGVYFVVTTNQNSRMSNREEFSEKITSRKGG